MAESNPEVLDLLSQLVDGDQVRELNCFFLHLSCLHFNGVQDAAVQLGDLFGGTGVWG
jgi:hypothetical protein